MTEEETMPDFELPKVDAVSESTPTPVPVFQALGWVKGIYTPQASDSQKGVIKTPDGFELSASVSARTQMKLKQQIKALAPGQPLQTEAGEPFCWAVYPKMSNCDLSHLTLLRIAPASKTALTMDLFQINGILMGREEPDTSIVRVYRNPNSRCLNNAVYFFDLKLTGQMPDLTLNQPVQIAAHRAGFNLVVDEAQPIEMELSEDIKENIQKTSLPRIPLPPPIKRTQSDQPKTVALPVSESVIEAPQPSADQEVPALIQSPTTEIVGQSELIIPAEVPLEVAPIKRVSPVLKQVVPVPAVTCVGEARIAAPSVKPELVENLKPESPTSTKPSEPVDSTKVSGSQAPVEPTVHELKKAKKATASIPAAAAAGSQKQQPEADKTPKPTFLVQVDRKQFPGMTSVTLKNGMLFIDGKSVTQTKLAIVVGEPQQVSADGKTQKSGNRTILSSR
jgi:hypothetical protein